MVAYCAGHMECIEKSGEKKHSWRFANVYEQA